MWWGGGGPLIVIDADIKNFQIKNKTLYCEELENSV